MFHLEHVARLDAAELLSGCIETRDRKQFADVELVAAEHFLHRIPAADFERQRVVLGLGRRRGFEDVLDDVGGVDFLDRRRHAVGSDENRFLGCRLGRIVGCESRDQGDAGEGDAESHREPPKGFGFRGPGSCRVLVIVE